MRPQFIQVQRRITAISQHKAILPLRFVASKPSAPTLLDHITSQCDSFAQRVVRAFVKSESNNEDDLLSVAKRFRGIAARVAAKVDVDPSLVSRVINGERKSPEIISALREELKQIRDALNDAIVDE